jgi:AcrR family transcriptional regulator
MGAEPEWDVIPLRRTPTQARSRGKVMRALEAAERIAERDGVEALTLTAVAAEADISVGALYQYLPDRDAIAHALAARYHARLEALLDDAIVSARAATPADPVGAVIDAVAEVYLDESTTRSLRRATVTDDAARAHKRRMSEKVRELLIAARVVPDDAGVDVLARVVFTASDAVLHDAFTEDEPLRARLLEELERMLRATIADTGSH